MITSATPVYVFISRLAPETAIYDVVTMLRPGDGRTVRHSFRSDDPVAALASPECPEHCFCRGIEEDGPMGHLWPEAIGEVTIEDVRHNGSEFAPFWVVAETVADAARAAWGARDLGKL